MSSKRDELLFISDILESANAIEGYVAGMSFDDFVKDRKTVSATVREFEIIGEAVANISDETKNQCPDILWRQLKAFRNKLIHEYFGVDTRIIWDVATNELTALRESMQKLLEEK
jgi:uncharacterized protein with HEPN domain